MPFAHPSIPKSAPSIPRIARTAAATLAFLAGAWGGAPAASRPETITYAVENFERFTPHLWKGRSEVAAHCRAETTPVHGGRRAMAITWDFRRCPKPSMCFANFVFHRRLIGRVRAVHVWIHAEPAARGAPIKLWLADRSGEIYIASVRVDWQGWKRADFSFEHRAPAWKSGDGDGVPEPPLSLFGIAVDAGGPPTGALVLDDVSATTRIRAPREALEPQVATPAPRNLFWNRPPRIRVRILNHASEPPAEPVRCELRTEDLYTGRTADSAVLDFKRVPPGRTVSRTREIPVGFGVFRIHWALEDSQGKLLAGHLDTARMLPRCDTDRVPAAIRRYDRRWSPIGGVFGFLDPKTAGAMGARWVRFETTTWATYETAPGKFDMAPLRTALEHYARYDITPILLQTLYQRPKFYTPDQPGFARAYGRVMGRIARAGRRLVHAFELGNEDNGPTQMLYSEVARHGAAAVRAEQPAALIANSATAFIDLGWLELQARRGVLDRVDALCTHPYSVEDSPETWNILDRLDRVNDLIDRLGGMKIQWATEFGWPHTFSQKRRAEWIPRHILIAAAAGLERDGLYTWERDYGIFQGTALPPAASVHALAKMLEGRRFAGLLRHDARLWVSVWERAERPLAAAWSPAGRGRLTLPVTPAVRIYDLFGNPLPSSIHDGCVRLEIGPGPVYITGAAPSVLAEAIRARNRREQARLARCVRRAGLPRSSIWTRLAEEPFENPAVLRSALEAWVPPPGPVPPPLQAVIAQALRWYLAAGRSLRPTPKTTGSTRKNLAQQRRRLAHLLADSIARDQDIPALRYLLHQWDRLADQAAVARACGAADYAARIDRMCETVAGLAAKFAACGRRLLFDVWPYLYTVAPGGGLRETLHFVPGKETRVRLRVNSYSRRDQRLTVAVRLPPKWRCTPNPVRIQTGAGTDSETVLRIRCPARPAGGKPEFVCELRTAAGATRRIRFDDIVLDAPVRAVLAPLSGLAPQTRALLRLANAGDRPVSGVLRLVLRSDGRALARVRFRDLPPGDIPRAYPLQFRAFAPPDFNEWPVTAQFLLSSGRRIEHAVSIDFACAVRAPTPPVLDGKLDDWRRAAPLHLDRAEYAKGSFGGNWSPADLSAATWVQWDPHYLYFAARVADQTFHQALSGRAIWMQDSIQFALAKDPHSPRTEIGLARTAKGPEVVFFTGNSMHRPGCRLAVAVRPGRAIYEAAIPWNVLPGLEHPAPGERIRYSVLVNDDDAVTGRRFLERYGGIAHDKDVRKFGALTLLSPVPRASRRYAYTLAPSDTVFIEDFEEYPPGKAPDAWEIVRHKPPFPSSIVVAGAGRNGSQALVLRNSTGRRPYVYLHLVRPLEAVRPGGKYELSCWMRASHETTADGIIGVCSDKWGNQSFSYARPGRIRARWRKVRLRFSGPPGGRLNLIVRNAVKLDGLAIDDIRVTRSQ